MSTSTTSSPLAKPSAPALPPEMQATKKVADQLVAFCRTGKHRQAIETLYADEAKHIEPMETPDFPRVADGKKAILAKSDAFDRTVTVHEWTCGDPEVNGEQFTCEMTLDATHNSGSMAGQRCKAHETCLYTVKNQRIVEAKFFTVLG